MASSQEEMKELIVDAAREIFARYGYKKTTLDDIASSLYKAKSSIYYYFKSKEDVFRAVIEYEAEKAKSIIHEAIIKETTPEAKFRTYFRVLLHFIDETANYYKLMQEEALEVMGFSDELQEKHKSDAINMIADILNEGIKTGDFTITDVRGTAEAFMLAFDGLWFTVYNRRINTEKHFDAHFDNLMNVVLYGIKTR